MTRTRRILLCVVASAVAAVGALGAFAWTRSGAEPPQATRLLTDRHGAYLGEVGVGPDERLGFWSAGERRCSEPDASCLPARVVAATVALEDRRFDQHPGVDPVAVGRALLQNHREGRRVSGASTLAMQVARLQHPGPRTWPRKIGEAATALALTARYGRDGVLERYLRLAPYGNNVHGIRYAARRYFHKPVADLSWAETALLVALPQAPGTMNPYRRDGLARATVRAEQVLDLLRDDGTLPATEHARAHEELGRLQLPARPLRPASTLHPVLALSEVRGSDPVVRTTLDLELQSDVQWMLHGAVEAWSSRGAGQAAAVVLDRETLAVRAAVGSVGWGGDEAGAIDFTRARRYPGSTLKPFLYAAALDRGVLAPDTVIDDLQRGPEGISNADHRFLGPLLPRQALANSRNVPAVHVANLVGLEEVYDVWERLGLHDGSVPVGHYGLGVAIGGMPVRLLDLTQAYGALASDGVLRPMRWLEDAPVEDGTRVFTADHARLVSAWLADPMARLPSFPRAGATEYPFAVSVKTGTSPDFRDSWAVGTSGDWIVGVWVGHPDWRPMRGISGYRGGARLVQQIMLDLHEEEADGLADLRAPGPDGWETHALCPLSGQRATEACDGELTEWFAPGRGPVHDCAVHGIVSGRTVVDLPSRYASWMERAGLTAAEPVRTDQVVAVSVLSPQDGMHVIRDPEVPADRATLRLQAAVDPPVEQVVWLVDGTPFAVVGHPYAVRWPVQAGTHTFEARLPYRPERSGAVRVVAR